MFDAYQKQKALRRRENDLCTRLGPFVDRMPELRCVVSDEIAFRPDVRIDRTAQGFDLLCHAQSLSGAMRGVMVHRLPTMILWRLRADSDLPSVMVHLSDGDHATAAPFLFASNLPDKILLPDTYFQETRGFEALRNRIDRMDVPWGGRSSEFVWRGSANGNGFFTLAPGLATHPATVQRIRMAWHCKGTEVDFGFVEPPSADNYPALEQAGLLRDRIAADTWFGRKFAIDIDGFSTTWDNLLHRMLMGCCVLKVQSDFGWRQWYYDRLHAWEHYVPVAADLSDFAEKRDWVRANDGEARHIAERGRAFALSLDYETEADDAGKRLNEYYAIS